MTSTIEQPTPAITGRGNRAQARQAERTPTEYYLMLQSFKRSLLASNVSPHTIQCYSDSVKFLAQFLEDAGMPTTPAAIHREHIEAFLAHLMNTPTLRGKPASPATAATRYRALRVFFNWLIEMGERRDHPMQNMKPPRLAVKPPAVLTENQLKRLIRACDGKDFEERRDMAIIHLLIDTGMRRS